MEPKSSDSRMIRSRSQQIRACAQVWAKCLASAQTLEEILAAEPATSKARLNLREALETALKEDWSSAAVACVRTPNGMKASADCDDNRQESSTAASVSIKNTHLVEDVLWKEVFYKPLTIAKRLKRPNSWNTNDMAVVRTYLEDGMDYYLSLLKLFSVLHSSTSGSSTTRTSVVVRCLCCLGDLSRYYCSDLSPGLSLLPGTARYMVPSQYYNQVLELSPSAALAHSNLASVLRSIHNAPLQAAVHYLAALRCSRFEGARVQLKQLMDHSISKYEAYYEGNPSYSQRQQSALEGHFLHTVLATVSCFAGEDEDNSHVEVNAICQDFLVQLGKLLQTSADYSSAKNDLQQTQRGADGVRGRGSREAVLLAAILLVAAHKRQTPQQGSTCAVLLASVLLTVVCQCLSALQHAITSLHSDDVLLALTLATKPRLPPQAVAGTSARNSSDERNESAKSRSQADEEEEVKNMGDAGGQKKRPAPRRRRLRRRPHASKGDSNSSGDDSDDDSSSGQEHISSDHSGWSSDDNREDSDEDSCTSEYDSGEDVIIESEDEVVEQASILASKGDQKSLTSSSTTTTAVPASHSCAAVASAPNATTNGPLADVNFDPKPNSASSSPAISALEHLKLITISDGSGGEKQQPPSPSFARHEQHKSSPASFIPTMKATSVDSSAGVTAGVGRVPPSSLLAAVCVLTAWLRTESVAKGTIVWCDVKSNNNRDVGDDGEANRLSAGQVESSRVLWKALVAFCNLICVDLRQLSSAENLDQLLPNLKDFMLLCRQTHITAGAKICYNSMLNHDCFVLPEDNFLKSTVPSVVPQNVLQQPPGVQCPHVAPYLHHVGVMKANDLTPVSRTSPTISDEICKLSLSEPCHNGVVSSKTPTASGGGLLLNATEESLMRCLRVRNDLRLLSEFEECPVHYCEETGLFSVQPRAGCVQSSTSSSTAGSGSNSNNCKPYYLKKVSFGGYVMDKVVRRRTRPRTEELRPANSGRERGRKPNVRERGRPSKNRRMPNGGGRRNLYPDRGQEFPRETSYGSRRRNSSSEELLRAGGRLGSGRRNRRREDKLLNYTQHIQADDSVEGFARLSDKRNWEVAKFDENNASSGGSVVSQVVSLDNNPDDANEIFGLDDLKDAPLISPDTTSPTNGKFGAIGDRRKAATAITADGSYVGGCAVLATIAIPSGETCGEGTSDDNEAAKKLKRDHGQRMLTARWLRHKLDTTDCKPTMYLVPDASAIVYHLDTIKSIVQQGQIVVVVPMQVLSDIDEAKRIESAARDASRWLDRVLLGRGDRVSRNATLRLQGASERAAMPGVQCPPKYHKTAWRWFQILECCHHLSRLEYFPKMGASEEVPTMKTVGRGVGSLYSDNQQQPTVLKNKHRSNLSQHKSHAVVQGSGLSLVPEAEDENLMDRTAVVTLLTAETGDTISKLPFQLGLLASRVAAKLVFVSDYKKTQTLSHGQT